MIISQKTLEIREMRRNKIINYFMDTGGEKTEQEELRVHGWKVHVGGENTINIGKLQLYSTKVTFYCDQSIIDKMVNDFRLNFLFSKG